MKEVQSGGIVAQNQFQTLAQEYHLFVLHLHFFSNDYPCSFKKFIEATCQCLFFLHFSFSFKLFPLLFFLTHTFSLLFLSYSNFFFNISFFLKRFFLLLSMTLPQLSFLFLIPVAKANTKAVVDDDSRANAARAIAATPISRIFHGTIRCSTYAHINSCSWFLKIFLCL